MAATVMVVDDSQMVRQQVGKALSGAGFSVVEAHDGTDALTKLSNGSIDQGPSLIVLDVNMPNMGGLEFLQNLRTNPDFAEVPVVLLTTEGDAKMMQQAKALGAKGWIVKPFRAELLIAAARKLTA